ncbi:hypothetical protein KGQ72_01010 [Patescibacteria group bacterium]|nr:hypothetical protein [Patescibacteria group bacterium]
MKKLGSVVVVLALSLPLVARGQGLEALFSIFSLAPNVGSLANPDSVDAGRAILTLPSPPKDFVSDVKTVAKDLGYQVAAAGTPGGELSVLLVKQSASIGNAFLGKDWQLRVNLSLKPDGRTVEITSGLKGNDVKNSGTAQEAVDTIKAKMLALANN